MNIKYYLLTKICCHHHHHLSFRGHCYFSVSGPSTGAPLSILLQFHFAKSRVSTFKSLIPDSKSTAPGITKRNIFSVINSSVTIYNGN